MSVERANLFARLVRFASTARHLQARQIANRVWRWLHRPRPRRFSDVAWRASGVRWQPAIEHPSALRQDRTLVVLNRSFALDLPELWRDRSLERLLQYHLHYFDELNAAGAAHRTVLLRELLALWMARNPIGEGPGWEPYPLSRRIVNWIKWSLAGNALSHSALDSLATQTGYLSQRVEYHVSANHLIANAKALIFAGCCLQAATAQAWREQGLKLLFDELAQQILPDGGHYERSPMYQAIVLEDLLDLVNVGRACGVPALEALLPTCAAMIRWLRALCHPDGGIALLNDATLDGSASCSQLDAYACQLSVPLADNESERQLLLEPTGFARLECGDWLLIADAAPLGPDHQPAHGHADTLTFELSYRARRLVVDTGVSTYEPGLVRLRERGTASHNTVRVDGRDSSQVWKSFRVGRRARILQRELANEGDGVRLRAAHDGYRHLGGVVHRRDWLLTGQGLSIRDEITGSGEHEIEWFLQLHPDCQVRQSGASEFEIVMAGEPRRLRLRVDDVLEAALQDGAYCPRFGVTQLTARIVARVRRPLPLVLQFSISTA